MQGAATANDQEMKPTQNKEKCPRCESFNTKFCYYNNYSLSQPRYFCKSCRRYWTQGGTLRNVPIGGGCRKAKRPKTLPSSSSSSSAAIQPAPPSAEVDIAGGVFGHSIYNSGTGAGGYLPSLEAIHQSTLNQTAPLILMDNQSAAVDVGVYSFGLSEQSWAHRSFGGDHGHDHNPTWTAMNDNNATNSSSAGNNQNSSVESEINCCHLVPNQWSHPP